MFCFVFGLVFSSCYEMMQLYRFFFWFCLEVFDMKIEKKDKSLVNISNRTLSISKSFGNIKMCHTYLIWKVLPRQRQTNSMVQRNSDI